MRKSYISNLGKNKKEKGVSLMLIYRKTPIRNIVARYIRKERVLYRQNTPYIRKKHL